MQEEEEGWKRKLKKLTERKNTERNLSFAEPILLFISPQENSSTIVLPHAGRISAGRLWSPGLWHPRCEALTLLISPFSALSSYSLCLDDIQVDGSY